MENEVTKKVKNSSNSAKNKSSSKKTATGTKKKSSTNKSKSSSVNKKSTPKKNTSSKNTKKNTTKKATTTVKSTVNKTNTTSTTPKKNNKKKSNTKKNNTYQYNKRNLDKNKKVEVEVKSDELVDESIHVDKVVTQEKFIFEDEKKTETIESILEGIDLNKNISKEEELEFTGLISVVDETNEIPEEFEKEIIEDILGEKANEDESVETVMEETTEKEVVEEETKTDEEETKVDEEYFESTPEEPVEEEITTDEVIEEVEVLDVSTTEVDESVIEEEFDKESTNDIEEILDEVLTDEEKVSIREEEILEDILEDKEKSEEFYPFDEEDVELDSEIRKEDIETLEEEEDSLFKTLRIDLYDVYDKDNDYDEENVSTKTVENVDDKFLLVDNILTEETRRNIIPDNVFVKEDKDEDEYYNVILWDSIIGFLLVVFTTLAIFAIWFMVYLTTY